jgi:hypothetical protein
MTYSTVRPTPVSTADGYRISMSRRQWRRLMRDLAARGRGQRESGAFLLADLNSTGTVRVRAWVAFDDLDPDCLNGAISIRSHAFGKLWEICRQRSVRVVADIHTHPGRNVQQSSIDAANPMIAKRGHVGVIVPDFAQGKPSPRDVGYHVYGGDRSWNSCFGDDAARKLERRWF